MGRTLYLIPVRLILTFSSKARKRMGIESGEKWGDREIDANKCLTLVLENYIKPLGKWLISFSLSTYTVTVTLHIHFSERQRGLDKWNCCVQSLTLGPAIKALISKTRIANRFGNALNSSGRSGINIVLAVNDFAHELRLQSREKTNAETYHAACTLGDCFFQKMTMDTWAQGLVNIEIQD